MSKVEVDQRLRLAGLDRLRGLAIVLMLVDHTVWLAGAEWARGTVTLLAVPLFMGIAGYLWRPGWRPRYEQVALAAGISGALALYMGLAAPVFLVVIVLALPIVAALHRWPAPAAMLGVLQALYWPVGWAGAEVGLVVACMMIGRLWRQAGGQEWRVGDLLPAWLGTVGRWPLTWYTGHMAAMALVWTLRGGAA